MPRLVCLAALASIAFVASAQSQSQPRDSLREKIPGRIPTDRLEMPSMPVKTLPLELLSAKPVHNGMVGYERSGLKPSHFRIGQDPQLIGSNWQPLGNVTEQTVTRNGHVVNSGTLPVSSFQASGSCGEFQGPPRKVWLQFRKSNLGGIGKHVTTAIRGDSVCVSFDG